MNIYLGPEDQIRQIFIHKFQGLLNKGTNTQCSGGADPSLKAVWPWEQASLLFIFSKIKAVFLEIKALGFKIKASPFQI